MLHIRLVNVMQALQKPSIHIYTVRQSTILHLLHICDVRIGQYIAVVYETKWCIAIIKQKCSITADRMFFYEMPSIQSGFIVLA